MDKYKHMLNIHHSK